MIFYLQKSFQSETSLLFCLFSLARQEITSLGTTGNYGKTSNAKFAYALV